MTISLSPKPDTAGHTCGLRPKGKMGLHLKLAEAVEAASSEIQGVLTPDEGVTLIGFDVSGDVTVIV